MYCNIDEVENYIASLREEKVILQTLNISYNPKFSSFTMKGKGPERVHKSDEYYENLQDNIDFLFMSMLERLALRLNTKIDLYCEINDEGEIELEKIHMFIYYFPQNVSSKASYMFPRLEAISVFHTHLENVSLLSHEKELSKITFELLIDCRKFTKQLIEFKPNKAVVSQWMAKIDEAERECKRQPLYHVTIPVINGRMASEILTRELPFRMSSLKRVKL